MRITLDLPAWVDERHIRILAGIELAAFKLSNEDFWRVKDVRCDQCGICCSRLKRHFFKTVDGVCEHLEKTGDKTQCKIAIMRPHPCANDPLHLIESGECCITYNII